MSTRKPVPTWVEEKPPTPGLALEALDEGGSRTGVHTVPGAPLLLGRLEAVVDVVLATPTASRQHAWCAPPRPTAVD